MRFTTNGCNGCIHEYSPVDCPCCEQCETNKQHLKQRGEKEEIIKYINNPVFTTAKNFMGCSENWYNPYFAIKETFTIDEIEKMSESEISNLIKLADKISEGLY